MDIAEKIVRAKTDYDEVYEAGQNKGYEEGRSAGYHDGFSDGYRDGDNVGRGEGIAAGYRDGYQIGKQAEYDAFWDAYQENGNRENYQGAFYGLGWTDATFKPKYDIRPTNKSSNNANSLFFMSRIKDIDKALKEAGVVLDLSKMSTLGSVFQACYETTTLPIFDISSCTTLSNFVFGMAKLTKLVINNIREDCVFSKNFTSCSGLTDLIITGTIGQNGFDVSACKLLKHMCLINILHCLKDYSTDTSGTTHTITLGSANLAKLSEDEKMSATQKGWSLV